MKYRLAALFLLLIVLAGCTPPLISLRGSGPVVTQEVAVEDFDRLDVSHAFRVDVRQSDSYSVVVRVDERLLEYLVVEVKDGTLTIGLEPSRTYTLGTSTREVDVTMPDMEGLVVSGASRVTLEGLQSRGSFRMDVSGASQVRGDMRFVSARWDVSGASTVDLTGTGDDLSVEVSGASTMELSDLAVTDATLSVSGASKATVRVSGRLDIEASGASSVYYLGEPSLERVNASGASTIRQR